MGDEVHVSHGWECLDGGWRLATSGRGSAGLHHTPQPITLAGPDAPEGGVTLSDGRNTMHEYSDKQNGAVEFFFLFNPHLQESAVFERSRLG